ncbi:hypothetical protein [Croceicoccus sp. BE223]|uniref:anti-sigma factor family protein n=1 Tax=Croceicoccus sp. BE223 TaxID=2817716 RepID=UPI00285DABDB|nr:hypothetical protein [Croceicoccus sp. BE223]MDR7102874.1 hypothetical protein [Croceicoccus sp. BE223]
MKVTREELAAFSDGELDFERHVEVERAVAADPDLERAVAAHRALRARLSTHFAPILDEPVPERLRTLLQHKSSVIDFDKQRQSRSTTRFNAPRWGWIAGPALAASLILALLIPREIGSESYASGQVAAALDGQLVATQPADAPVRVMLSFRDRAGAYCRAYSGADQAGIACKDAHGWRMIEHFEDATAERGEYRQAGSGQAQLMMRAQDMASGSALNGGQELQARSKGWKPHS